MNLQLVALSLFFHYYCLHVTGGFRQFMTMKLMDNRKLATIRRIKSIRSIPGADKIVCSEIDGWTAVVKKGRFFKRNFYVTMKLCCKETFIIR